MPTPSKIKEFHTLLSRAKLPVSKAEMVDAISDGRTTSTKGLTDAELQGLIDSIRSIQQASEGGTFSFKALTEAEKANNQRRRVIAMAHQLGWYITATDGSYVLRNGKPQIDFKHLNQWCIKHGSFGKPLQAHTTAELPTLIRNIERVVKHRADTAR